jgi:CO/xanthine dehydrogenase FAD-binding subunit
MKEAKYFAPTGLEEAVRILAEFGEKTTLLAGGTDLVPKINYYELKPEVIVFLGGLGLDYLKEANYGLVVGASTTTARLAEDALVAKRATALAEAAHLSGSEAIRNSATIGGNLANASPAADLATPLLVLDAEVLIRGSEGERVLPLAQFFKGPGHTALKPQELLLEIRIPPVKGKTVFLKLGRRKAMTLSVVNVAVRLDMNGKKCNEARVALGSMGPTPLRCEKAETMLKGKTLDRELVKACAAKAIDETHPIDDQRATAWYRKQAGMSLAARALARASGLDL